MAPILAPLPLPAAAAIRAHLSIAAAVHAHLSIAATVHAHLSIATIDSFLVAHPAHTICAHMDSFPRACHPPHAMMQQVLRNRLGDLVGNLAVEDRIGSIW
jgi:hypothetical protein